MREWIEDLIIKAVFWPIDVLHNITCACRKSPPQVFEDRWPVSDDAYTSEPDPNECDGPCCEDKAGVPARWAKANETA